MYSNQIQSIIDYKDTAKEFFVFQVDDCDESRDEDSRLLSFYENVILDDVDQDEEKILALMEHTVEEYSECETHLDLDRYRVYTDEEANDAGHPGACPVSPSWRSPDGQERRSSAPHEAAGPANAGRLVGIARLDARPLQGHAAR